jgi:hypothetical protein
MDNTRLAIVRLRISEPVARMQARRKIRRLRLIVGWVAFDTEPRAEGLIWQSVGRSRRGNGRSIRGRLQGRIPNIDIDGRENTGQSLADRVW